MALDPGRGAWVMGPSPGSWSQKEFLTVSMLGSFLKRESEVVQEPGSVLGNRPWPPSIPPPLDLSRASQEEKDRWAQSPQLSYDLPGVSPLPP